MAAISTVKAKFSRLKPTSQSVFLWDEYPEELKELIEQSVAFDGTEVGVFGYAESASCFLLVTDRRIVIADRMLRCSVSLRDLIGIGLMEKVGEEQEYKHIVLDARCCNLSIGIRADGWHVVYSILKFVVMNKELTID